MWQIAFKTKPDMYEFKHKMRKKDYALSSPKFSKMCFKDSSGAVKTAVT